MKQPLNNDYWDYIADKVIAPVLESNIASYYRSEHIRLIKNWAGGLKGKSILKTDLYEEAFGEDHFLFWLLRQDAKVFGIDISCKIAGKAKLRSKEYNAIFKNCVTSDIADCSFKDESFDLIISNSTLDNLDFQKVERALFEMRRILKKGGILILTLDNAHNPLYVLGYCIEKVLKTNKFYQGRCYSLKEAECLAKKLNFEIQDVTSIVHIPTPFNKVARLLKTINNEFFTSFIRRAVILFSKLGNKKSKFSTGWFIALKLRKQQTS